jgi:hypothetical protein
VDYNHDGKPDFLVQVDTETLETRITPHAAQVKGWEETIKLKQGIAIRVHLNRS